MPKKYKGEADIPRKKQKRLNWLEQMLQAVAMERAQKMEALLERDGPKDPDERRLWLEAGGNQPNLKIQKKKKKKKKKNPHRPALIIPTR